MAKFDVTIKVESSIHLGSGQADINIDSEIVHDAYGLPYFPAKRFKGLLYESAVEIYEMFELAEMYRKGETVEQNTFKAVLWYSKAIECDYWECAEAMYQLGEIYIDGEGVMLNKI